LNQRGLCVVYASGARRHLPAADRLRLEQLCRYLLRPAVAQDRLRLLDDGRIMLTLKAAWADGTRQLVFEPLELLEKLAALTPRPRINLVLYHGVLAPHAGWRARVIASSAPPVEASVAASASADANDEPTTAPLSRHWAWADLMRRAFDIDVLACPRCGGRMRLIATVEDPDAIRAILATLALSDERADRAPPFVPSLNTRHTAAIGALASPGHLGRRGLFAPAWSGSGSRSKGSSPIQKSLDCPVVRAVPGGARGVAITRGGTAEKGLDQRGQLLRAAVGFATCSMPSYDRALWALRTWLDSWTGIGHVAVGMHRQGYDLQLTQYDERGISTLPLLRSTSVISPVTTCRTTPPATLGLADAPGDVITTGAPVDDGSVVVVVPGVGAWRIQRRRVEVRCPRRLGESEVS